MSGSHSNSLIALAMSAFIGLMSFGAYAEEFKGISIWEGREQFVRIVPRDGGELNKQPAKLTKVQIRGALSRVSYVDGSSEPVDLFTKEELNFISPILVKAFAAAGPADDVIVNTIGLRRVFIGFTKPQIMSLRMFVDETGLNVLVGDIFMDPQQSANGYLKVLNDPRLADYKIPSRAAILDTRATWVLKGQEPAVVIKRQDWAIVPPALWVPPVSDLPPEMAKNQKETQTQLQLLQQQIQQLQKGGGVPSAGFMPPQQPSAVVPPTRSVEERIKTLDDLKAKGLLSPEEYAAKRKHILEAL